MSNEEEDQRIVENLIIVRSYLKEYFKVFALTEDQSHQLLYHQFTVVELQPQTQYKLKVSWPQISDKSNTPTKIKHLLISDDVAARMIASKGAYFSWGWH